MDVSPWWAHHPESRSHILPPPLSRTHTHTHTVTVTSVSNFSINLCRRQSSASIYGGTRNFNGENSTSFSCQFVFLFFFLLYFSAQNWASESARLASTHVYALTLTYGVGMCAYDSFVFVVFHLFDIVLLDLLSFMCDLGLFDDALSIIRVGCVPYCTVLARWKVNRGHARSKRKLRQKETSFFAIARVFHIHMWRIQ